METKNERLYQALADLSAIKRAIIATGEGDEPRQKLSILGGNLYLQTAALLGALILVLTELLSGNFGTYGILISRNIPWLQAQGILNIGAFLCIVTVFLYVFAAVQAKKFKQDKVKFIVKNYTYLKNFNFATDLLIKFLVFCLLILAPKPEWIAPLFALFTADYLFQSRFFTIPGRISLPLGLLCVLEAVLLIYFECVFLIVPAVTFVVVAAISIYFLLQQKSEVIDALEEENDC